MNYNQIDNHSVDQAKEEKPSATCLGFTRQELIKMQQLTKSSIIFCILYLILGVYLIGLIVYSQINPDKPKLLKISSQILLEVIMPVGVINGFGKLLTFYSSSKSSQLGMKLSSFSQLIAISLDIYSFIKVVKEGNRIGTGYFYDDLLLVSFIYFCIWFDFIYLLATIVLNVQLTVYGFIKKPKLHHNCNHNLPKLIVT
ncbi:uncharacterized protein LOC128398086 [Panonychus citri]|uniref:uncharacterized protein LOC128398086 n=1 Tax=Panonychus citri TaxID=50023 RepID=UPI002306DDF8|nr:uncharacterized protein LOC128398086 [Panonychus citri]